MDISEAKAKISKLTDPRLSDVATLLVDLDLELVACCEEVKKGRQVIGDIDLLFKDKEVKTIFLVEVSTLQKNRAPKINIFFTRWEDQENIRIVRSKYQLPLTYKIDHLYFDLSGKSDCPSSIEAVVQRNRNHFLNKYDFDYFVDTYIKVGKLARNDLFSFLDIRPSQPMHREVDAIQFYLGSSVRAYAYVDTAKNLLQYCYVFRRKKADVGYQRVLQKGRIGDIAKKIQKADFFAFPNAILITCPDGSELCSNPKVYSDCPSHVRIRLPNYFSACRVIDGQHRLLGFAWLQESYQESHFIPVVILENIQQFDEMKTFIEINREQKKIDKNLILALQADFDWDINENERQYFEKLVVEAAKKLNGRPPLKGKIFIPEALAKKKGKIALATLVAAIMGNNFVGGKYHLFQKDHNDSQTPYRKIREIFVLSKQKLPRYCKDTGSFLLTNKGLRILFRLVQIFERNRRNKNIRFTLPKLFDDLHKIFNDSLVERLEDFYGEGGANRATEEIFRALKKLDKQKYKGLTTDLRQV